MCSLGVHGAHCSASRVADYPQTIGGVEVWAILQMAAPNKPNCGNQTSTAWSRVFSAKSVRCRSASLAKCLILLAVYSGVLP